MWFKVECCNKVCYSWLTNLFKTKHANQWVFSLLSFLITFIMLWRRPVTLITRCCWGPWHTTQSETSTNRRSSSSHNNFEYNRVLVRDKYDILTNYIVHCTTMNCIYWIFRLFVSYAKVQCYVLFKNVGASMICSAIPCHVFVLYTYVRYLFLKHLCYFNIRTVSYVLLLILTLFFFEVY